MKISPSIYELSVVLVGDFNPRIFIPLWFVNEGLIEQEHIDDDSIDVVHPDVSQFSTEWGSIYVDKHQFRIRTQVAPLIRIVDLASKLFGEKLPHTPVRAFAINHGIHFKATSDDAYQKFGTTLSPHAAWGEWGKSFCGEGSERGGLINIEMVQNNVPDRESGHVQCRVQPSKVEKPFGLFSFVNDHFNTLDKENNARPASGAAELISTEYEPSLQRAKIIFDDLMLLAQ